MAGRMSKIGVDGEPVQEQSVAAAVADLSLDWFK